LLVVPGSIFSKTSAGVHQFLKLGATPVTSSKDILEILGLEVKESINQNLTLALSPSELEVLRHLNEPQHRDELIRKINLSTAEASQLLMMMELQGYIKSEQNVYRANL
jgi:DNA processing protein